MSFPMLVFLILILIDDTLVELFPIELIYLVLLFYSESKIIEINHSNDDSLEFFLLDWQIHE